MTIYQECLFESLNCTDKDAYISDLSLSSLWNDDPDSEIPTARLEYLSRLYESTHRDFRGVLAAANLTRQQISERFDIPRRSVENWFYGISTPPQYLLMLIQESLGLCRLQPPAEAFTRKDGFHD